MRNPNGDYVIAVVEGEYQNALRMMRATRQELAHSAQNMGMTFSNSVWLSRLLQNFAITVSGLICLAIVALPAIIFWQILRKYSN